MLFLNFQQDLYTTQLGVIAFDNNRFFYGTQYTSYLALYVGNFGMKKKSNFFHRIEQKRSKGK